MRNTRQFTKITLTALIAILGMATGVQADVLASYEFTGGDLSPTATGTGFTASDMGRPSGMDLPVTFTTDYVYGDGYQVKNSEAESLSYGSYFEFTVTPDSGAFSLDGYSLTFDTAYLTYNSAGLDTTVYFVRWSGDAYASNLGTFAELGQNQANPPYVWTGRSVDMAGTEFQGLSEPVTFRIYMYNSYNGSVHLCAFDNVELAETAVPEPATMGLLGLGGLLVLRRRQAA